MNAQLIWYNVGKQARVATAELSPRCREWDKVKEMNSQLISDEVEQAISASEDIRKEQVDLDNIETEICKLELEYRRKPSQDTKLKLIARYVLLAQSLPVLSSGAGIKVRERFQQQFPDHFKCFMDILRGSMSSTRWSGCTLCKHNLGHGCAKGLRPRKLPSRFLDRDYTCSVFEAKY
jgi:hypothetical protein